MVATKRGFEDATRGGKSQGKFYLRKNDTITRNRHTLYRIVALREFINKATGVIIHEGEEGGYVDSESALAQDGTCWIGRYAKVYDGSVVSGDAWVTDNAEVLVNVRVRDRARISGDTIVADASLMMHDVKISEKAHIVRSVIDSYAQVGGTAQIGNANVTGYAIIIRGRHTGVTISRLSSDHQSPTMVITSNGKRKKLDQTTRPQGQPSSQPAPCSG